MKVLGIIGARSGSKGLPGKNVRPLCGRPLMAWAIGTARSCRQVDRVILSTDSEAYAAVGREHGAETPFLRPAEHASDQAIELGYIRHALAWLVEHESYRPDLVVRVCPTAPLIRREDVEACIDLLAGDPDAHSAIIMAPAREHPRKMVKVAPDGVHVVSYITEKGSDVAPTNRQSYAAAFNRQSLPIVSRFETIMERNSQTGDIVRFHVIDQESGFDIDTDGDFRIVEGLMAKRREASKTGS